MRCYNDVVLTRTTSDSGLFSFRQSNPIPISTIPPQSVKFPTRNGTASFILKLSASACSVNNETVPLEECGANEKSLYSVLGVVETVSFEEVKQAYKKLARKYHPDVSPPERVEEYTKRFIELKEAYETLSDPITRAMYDTHLAIGLHFAFSSTPTYHYHHHHHHHHQVAEQKNEWKNRWQTQLSELKRRSNCRYRSGGNMSWAARLRQRRDGLYNDYD